MKQYVSLPFMRWLFDIDIGSLSRYISFTRKVLLENLSSEVNIPDRNKRIENGLYFEDNINKVHKLVTMCIDGSEQYIPKSSDRAIEEYHFSGNVVIMYN